MKLIEIAALKLEGFDEFALNGLSLEVEKGEIYALLGARDSGKSLIFRLLSGFEKPDEGECLVLGLEAHKKRLEIFQKAVFVPEVSVYDEKARAVEYLKMLHGLRKLRAFNDDVKLMQGFDIDVKKPLSMLSLEQKKLISICFALSLKPELCVFDNPFSYIGDENIEKLKKLMLEYTENGGTIFMTADKIKPLKGFITRLGRLKSGRVINEIARQELDRKKAKVFDILFSSTDDAFEFSERWEGEKELFDERVLVLVSDTPMPLIKLLNSFTVRDINILSEKDAEDFMRERGAEFI